MNSNKHFVKRQGNVLASNPLNYEEKTMNEPEVTNLVPTENNFATLLHDFKNQLGGLKLYAAFLRKSLAANSLDTDEGIAVCDKMIAQLDALNIRAKEAARALNTPATNHP